VANTISARNRCWCQLHRITQVSQTLQCELHVLAAAALLSTKHVPLTQHFHLEADALLPSNGLRYRPLKAAQLIYAMSSMMAPADCISHSRSRRHAIGHSLMHDQYPHLRHTEPSSNRRRRCDHDHIIISNGAIWACWKRNHVIPRLHVYPITGVSKRSNMMST